MTVTRGETLNTLALESGFVKRKPKKIDPKNLLMAFFIMILQSGKSLTSIAMTLGTLKDIRVSKQAIDKRIKEPFVQYLELVLAHTITQKITTSGLRLASVFKRILVHDSTTIRLPAHLSNVFPGSSNGKKKILHS